MVKLFSFHQFEIMVPNNMYFILIHRYIDVSEIFCSFENFHGLTVLKFNQAQVMTRSDSSQWQLASPDLEPSLTVSHTRYRYFNC